MKLQLNIVSALIAGLIFWVAPNADAHAAEKRIALVVGNAAYKAGAIPTPANDAGLIAQTLQAAGFDVIGVRDLDQDSLRRTIRDFISKASASGPDTVAFVYLSGYGLQLEGENYFAPTDANIARDANVPSEALRVSDYTKALAGLGIKASILILDGARANPFVKSGSPLAGGLALVEPDPGTLIAFNAAPGTVAPNEAGPYSSYAQALAEMMREGGLPITDLFNRVRLRVNETTKGAQVPWNSSKLQAPFYFFDRAPDAPPPQVSAEQTSTLRSKPIRDLSAQDAYLTALDRDNIQDYESFLVAYPNDPMARRVRAIVAARRESATWRQSRMVDTPPAYWSYLRRYPRGSHAYDARRRLAYLTAALEPPQNFEIITYEVPPPPPEEVIYVERPVLIFDDPDFGFEPPPPSPVFFLPPRPVYFVDLAPPPPPLFAFVLPVPAYSPVPVWVNTPDYVAPPPNNVIYNNIHNTVVVNNTTNTVVITNPSGQSQTFSPPAQSPASQTQPAIAAKSSPSNAAIVSAGIVGAGAAALLAPSLPPSVAPKAIPIQNTTSPPTVPSGQPQPAATPPANGKPPVAGQILAPSPSTLPVTPGQAPNAVPPDAKPAQALPGSAGGQPLPPVNGKPPVASLPPANSQPTPTATPAQTPKTSLPETKSGQPIPGAGEQPLPPINGKPPVAGLPAAPSQPTPTATPAQTPKTSLPDTKSGQPLSGAGAQPLPPINSKPPSASQPPPPSQAAPSAAPALAPKPVLPDTKSGQPLPGAGGTALPPTSTKSPVAVQPQSPQPKTPSAATPSMAPPPPVARQAPSPPLPPVVHQAAPPPPVVHQASPPSPPPPVVHQAPPPPPPPPVVHQAPPPPVVHQAAPPPPPVVHQAAPPSPPPVVHQAPPPPPSPPVVHQAPPPPPAAAKPCVLPTGQACPK